MPYSIHYESHSKTLTCHKCESDDLKILSIEHEDIDEHGARNLTVKFQCLTCGNEIVKRYNSKTEIVHT